MSEEEALEVLARQYGIEAPQNAVDEEISALEQEFHYRLRYEGLAGRYLAPEEIQTYLDELPAEAARRVRARLAVERLIRESGITVTQEELEAEAVAVAVRQNMPLEQVKDFLGKDLASLRRDLLERKAIELARSAGCQQTN